jgi:hypothetical protein
MKFLLEKEVTNARLLQVILFFAVVYLTLLWFSNILFFVEKTGFTYDSVVKHYLGSEDEFRNPVSYRGLLESTHFHLFVIAVALLLLNHLAAFVPVSQHLKLSLIVVSFTTGLTNMASGWLVRYAAPEFAYLKVASFVLFQASMGVLLVLSFLALGMYREGNGRENGDKA